MAAVCGTWASSIASSASGVPATDTRTAPRPEAGGMSLNAAGSWSLRTTAHGPASVSARYQRPEISTKTLPVLISRTTGVSVFAMYISSALPIGSQDGGPSVAISSVGSVATMIFGGVLGGGAEEVPGGISFATSAGGASIGAHGPLGSFAPYQILPPLM